jgi:hypothetical protein
MTWRYWPFDPPHPLCCTTIEWVIGDEEGPASDTPIAGDAVELLARDAAGRWPCISVWWRPVG